MSTKGSTSPAVSGASVIHLRLSSLLALCVVLILTTAASVAWVLRNTSYAGVTSDISGPAFGQPSVLTGAAPAQIPPWGELVKYDLEVEQPEEYVAFEPLTDRVLHWHFPGHTQSDVRFLLTAAGLTPPQVEEALQPEAVLVATNATILTPATNLVYSLIPDVRAQLYRTLAQWEQNRYMRFPYCLLTNDVAEFFAHSGVGREVITEVGKLVYQRNGRSYFSDLELVVNQIPSPEERRAFFKALTRTAVVMARLRIRPESDVDKLVGYWANNTMVRQKDLRPLLESVQRREGGGTLSLVYLLPPFARERLFTTPLPGYTEDPAMDCHWSAMNFFSAQPDFRFSDLSYTAAYIKSNYYTVAQPSAYGDLIFLLDQQGNAIHSAVHIADDIVFTKNGNNYAQPWVLMRLPNLIALYTVTDTPRTAFYRNKSS